MGAMNLTKTQAILNLDAMPATPELTAAVVKLITRTMKSISSHARSGGTVNSARSFELRDTFAVCSDYLVKNDRAKYLEVTGMTPEQFERYGSLDSTDLYA